MKSPIWYGSNIVAMEPPARKNTKYNGQVERLGVHKMDTGTVHMLGK